MSAGGRTAGDAQPVADRGAAWRRLFRDRPLIPLLGLLWCVLVIVIELAQPGIVIADWVGLDAACRRPAGDPRRLPDADHADRRHRPVGRRRGSMAGFVVATLVGGQGLAVGHPRARSSSRRSPGSSTASASASSGPPADHDPGHGPGRPRLANVWQLPMVQTGRRPAEPATGSARHRALTVLPNSLLVFVPLAALILLGLRRTGYGRLLYAVGDNPIAARLSGVAAWQVLVVLYVISALLAAIAGFLISGLTNVASVTLVDSYRPAVGRRRGHRRDVDHGRPGGYAGTIVGALILTVADLAPDVARDPGGRPPDPVRRDHRGRGGRLHAGDRRDLIADGPLDPPPRSRPRRDEHQVGRRRRARGRRVARSTATRCRTPAAARARTPSWPASRRSARRPSSAVPGRLHVGIGVPGLYDPATERRASSSTCPAPGPAGRGGPVGDALGLPAALINDARAFGLAELRLGAAAARPR